jgi:hypothetical protein
VTAVRGGRVARLAAGAALVAGVALATAAAPAAAQAGPVPAPGGTDTACADDAPAATAAWDCLPFYRWSDDADRFYSNYGPSEIGKASVMQPLVTFLYGMAGLMWQLLGWLTRTALAFDLFDLGGRSGAGQAHAPAPAPLQPVNDGYAMTADLVLSGLGLVALAIAITVMVTRMVRNGEHPVRDLIRPFACLALLLLLLTRAAPGPGGDVRTGSPAWLAGRGVQLSNVVADQISAAAPRASPGREPADLLDCHYYVEALRASFDRGGGAQGGGTGAVAFQPHLASMMSSLWEAAYLDLWIQAQFGDDETLSHRAYCRMLEQGARVPPADQAAIQAAAAARLGAAVPPAGTEGTAPFGPYNGDKDFRRGMIAWAACGWYKDRSHLKEVSNGRLVPLSGPGFAINPEFRRMWSLGTPPSETRSETCSKWWGTDGSGTTKPDPRGTKWGVADGDGPFQFGTANDIDEAFGVFLDEDAAQSTAARALGVRVSPITAADRANLPEARAWVYALNGHNLPASVPHAFMAIVIAGIYLWAIGGLALGTLVAQFLTVLFLVALPVLLVLGMWPSDGARRLFWRYVRIGAGSLVAKTAFVSLLAILLTLISVVARLGAETGAFGAVGGTGGLGAAMLQAAAPVAAIWAMRWALKDLGMGNILSLKGALGLTARLTRGERDGAPGPAGAPGRAAADRSRQVLRRRIERRAVVRDRRRSSADSRKPDADRGKRPGDGAPAGGIGAGRRAAKKAAAGARDGAGTPGRDTPRARGAALLGTVADPASFTPEALRDGEVPAPDDSRDPDQPLVGARFAFPPVAGVAALVTWAARRSDAARAPSGGVPADHGRAPTAAELAGAPEAALGAAYGRHVEAIAAAAAATAPRAATRHPDVVQRPVTVARRVAADGTVRAVTSSGRSVALPTPGWAAPDGRAFAAPRGYRATHHRRHHITGGVHDRGPARHAGHS